MQALPDESVDLVFADPPFNIGYKYDVYDDRKSAEDYLEWSRTWIEQVLRVLKSDGAFWLAIGDTLLPNSKCWHSAKSASMFATGSSGTTRLAFIARRNLRVLTRTCSTL